MRIRLAAFMLVATLPALSCTNATTPTPAASATPTPQPSSTPTPAPITSPTPEPSAPPEGTHDPAVYATAGVHSYLRKGQLYRQAAKKYKPGDVVYLNCTPRDAKGNKTDNHGPVRYWNIWSTNLTNGVDFYYTDIHSFNPDLHIYPTSGNGSVKAQCVVLNLPTSNTHTMNIEK